VRLTPGGAGALTVAGALAQRPGRGGHAWVFLQYLLGFQRLGWDVLFVDRLEPEMCVDEAGRRVPVGESANLRYLAAVMDRAGLAGRWAVLHDHGGDVLGRSRADVVEHVRRSAFLLNVMGYLDDAELMAAAPRRVFLDIDPGFGQMWLERGLADVFAGHDDHVTVGLNVGTAGCGVPTVGRQWVTTVPPVVLAAWPPADREQGADGRFTSVVSWRGPFDPVELDGRVYGLRCHELRRFVDLPCRAPDATFELALDIDPSDEADRRRLVASGWHLVDPVVAADPWSYQSYVAGSGAELMVAKNMYVQSASGWFSDRSACYLASGRPVLAQDTGLAGHLPAGDGLVTFRSLDEAVAGVAEIGADYEHHRRAARDVAAAHFDSDLVLGRLLSRLGIA